MSGRQAQSHEGMSKKYKRVRAWTFFVQEGFKCTTKNHVNVFTVGAVGHDFRLDDGYQALALADGRVAGQAGHALVHGGVRGNPGGGVDLQHVAPLREAGPLRVGLGAPGLEVVEPLGPGFRVAQRPHLGVAQAVLGVALVQLDAGDHAVALDQVHHLGASRVLLEQSLPVQDHAADVLAHARGGVEQGAVRGAVFDRVRDLLGLGVA